MMEHERGRYEATWVTFFRDMLEDLSGPIQPESSLLDFGCGEGWAVYHFRRNGFKAYGADIVGRYEDAQRSCREEGLVEAKEEIFRPIALEPYRIPFDNDMFDYIVSDQVFEHVQNYPQAIREIKRVLKPGGSSLHIIPSRYRPIEGHVFVPFGGIFRAYPYLALCALLGIHNSFQQQMSWKKVAELNYNYLRSSTTYYRKPHLRRLFAAEFEHVSFVEGTFIKHHPGRVHRYLYTPSRTLSFIPWVFCSLHSRVVFVTKPTVRANGQSQR